MLAMFVFNHGQPVLFYISPIFIIGLMGKAYYDGCFGIFWNGVKIKKRMKKIKMKKMKKAMRKMRKKKMMKKIIIIVII